jgi:hypothetical protein
MAGFFLWLWTAYRVFRLPWLKGRLILATCCFVSVPVHVAGGSGWVPVLFPLVLLWTFLFPGRPPVRTAPSGS